MLFTELSLHPTLLSAIAAVGYAKPTPIQQSAIPHVLAGRDLIALAQTGTGKTAAFALPTLHRLQAGGHVGRHVRVLVLAPTRELATQIGDGFRDYGKGLGFSHTVIFGGVGKEPQLRALRSGAQIVVATPGRLLDLMGDGHLDFSRLEVLILDEADRMLDMGFIHDVKKIIAALPKKRQTLLFSATMPSAIEELSRRILVEPVRVAVAPPSTTVEAIDQSVYPVPQTQKRALLLHLLADPTMRRVLVFARTKHGANRIAEHLDKHGVPALAIHGNKSQSARERALEGFRDGTLRVLVATDIAARGIDIDDVTHVIQVDLPEVPEQYVHRIGRTARAGASGTAIAFCSPDERVLLRDIEKDIKKAIPVVAEHPFLEAGPVGSDTHHDRVADRGGGRGGRGGGGGGGGRGGGGGGGAGRGGGAGGARGAGPASRPAGGGGASRSPGGAGRAAGGGGGGGGRGGAGRAPGGGGRGGR